MTAQPSRSDVTLEYENELKLFLIKKNVEGTTYSTVVETV